MNLTLWVDSFPKLSHSECNSEVPFSSCATLEGHGVRNKSKSCCYRIFHSATSFGLLQNFFILPFLLACYRIFHSAICFGLFLCPEQTLGQGWAPSPLAVLCELLCVLRAVQVLTLMPLFNPNTECRDCGAKTLLKSPAIRFS